MWPTGRSKLRRAAALMLLCEEAGKKDIRGYSGPSDRVLDLSPGSFKAVCRIAVAKGVDVNDLVATLCWQFVRDESEKEVAKHTYRTREKSLYGCCFDLRCCGSGERGVGAAGGSGSPVTSTALTCGKELNIAMTSSGLGALVCSILEPTGYRLGVKRDQ